MPQLAEAQRQFAAALLDPDMPPPPGLVGPDGEPSARRFAVYRNNVVAGLILALKDAFPAVCRIVGEDFFRVMAREYVLAKPPTSPVMLGYGRGFPSFVGHFEPAAGLAYLADVARIERAWVEAYHAPDAVPLDGSSFGAIAPEALSELRLQLHPSLRVVRSAYPALTIWRMNVGDGVPVAIDPDAAAEDAVILRPAAEVEVRFLPEGGADFLLGLGQGQSVLAATTSALDASPRFELAANLAGLIRAGAIIGHSFENATAWTATARQA